MPSIFQLYKLENSDAWDIYNGENYVGHACLAHNLFTVDGDFGPMVYSVAYPRDTFANDHDRGHHLAEGLKKLLSKLGELTLYEVQDES